MMTKILRGLGATTCMLALVAEVPAQGIRIEVENLQPSDGFYFTPVWFGLHDGGFDLFNSGEASSSELQTVAEGGDVGPLGTLFNADTNGDGSARQGGVITAPAGFGGAPVFDPGEVEFLNVDVDAPASNRYFSFASMVIPSNDAFVGNGNPMAWEIFDAAGNFNGPVTIELSGASIYDAGTEENTGTGAAFSLLADTPTVENGVVTLHPGLANFVGTDIPPGTAIGSAIDSAEPFARITITQIPEPASLLLMLPLGLISWRRRTR